MGKNGQLDTSLAPRRSYLPLPSVLYAIVVGPGLYSPSPLLAILPAVSLPASMLREPSPLLATLFSLANCNGASSSALAWFFSDFVPNRVPVAVGNRHLWRSAWVTPAPSGSHKQAGVEIILCSNANL